MRPAMVVLALAVLILAVFVTIGAVTSRSAPAHHRSAPTGAVPGTALHAVPASAMLSPIARGGEPPRNVLQAVFVPAGSVRVSHRDHNLSAGQFDSEVVFRSTASQAALLDFFAADMKFEGWQVFDRGPAARHPGTLEVLGKLAGSDGYYWEMGATVPPTTFSPGGPAHGESHFTIRLFQVSDGM